MAGDCRVFKFLRRNVDRKHLMRFLSETFRFQIWCCMDRAIIPYPSDLET